MSLSVVPLAAAFFPIFASPLFFRFLRTDIADLLRSHSRTVSSWSSTASSWNALLRKAPSQLNWLRSSET